SPGAGLLAVYPARRVELLRIAHEPRDERLDPLVVAVTREGDVADHVAGEARCAVVSLQDPAHPAHLRLAELLEDVPRRTTHPRIAGIDAVLHKEEVRPVRALVLRSVEAWARPARVTSLAAQDRRDRWRAHRPLLGFVHFGIAGPTVEERAQRTRPDGRIAALGTRAARGAHGPARERFLRRRRNRRRRRDSTARRGPASRSRRVAHCRWDRCVACSPSSAMSGTRAGHHRRSAYAWWSRRLRRRTGRF